MFAAYLHVQHMSTEVPAFELKLCSGEQRLRLAELFLSGNSAGLRGGGIYGDGKTDQAVYRDGSWFIRRSSDGGAAENPADGYFSYHFR
jgi:predicted outer membrane repeat protein